jgi:glycosyltransferase involved in cell wall biosynthesis
VPAVSADNFSMRILQIVHEFPPDAWAGTELVTLQLSRVLQARGHEVTVMTRVADPTAEEFSCREEQRYGLNVITIVNNYTQTTNLSLGYDNHFFENAFVQLLKRRRPDVVHFQHVAHLSVNLISTAVALGYPTVLSLHDFYFACHLIHLIDNQRQLCAGPERGERCVSCLREADPSGEVRRRFPFMAKVLQEPDLVLTPSRFLAERMLSYFPELEGRLRVVPLGVERPHCSPISRSFKKPLRILCVGVLIPHKGAHVLLEAIQELPSEAVEVSLYGIVSPYWQPYVDQLHELAKGSAVHFRGVYDHAELGDILAQHDVLVMPGICEETFSLMTREALLAGLPVIAARRGALTEAVQDGKNGFLFDPESPEDLRRCLSKLINDPELAKSLSNSPTQVRTPDEYATDIEAIYAEVCTGSLRTTVLQERLARQYQLRAALQQESEQQQAALKEWNTRKTDWEKQAEAFETESATLRQTCEHSAAATATLTDRLHIAEARAQEYEKRLTAIYTSTTWKCYRGYETLKQWLCDRPLGRVRRWWIGQVRS